MRQLAGPELCKSSVGLARVAELDLNVHQGCVDIGGQLGSELWIGPDPGGLLPLVQQLLDGRSSIDRHRSERGDELPNELVDCPFVP